MLHGAPRQGVTRHGRPAAYRRSGRKRLHSRRIRAVEGWEAVAVLSPLTTRPYRPMLPRAERVQHNLTQVLSDKLADATPSRRLMTANVSRCR